MADIEHRFIGGLWEGKEFCIRFNEELDFFQANEKSLCPHAGPVLEKPYILGKTSLYQIIPRVVVAYNEGGYCSTGVCLDCILEAAKTLES